MKTILLFKNDLRLRDNPALYEACRRSDAIIPLYIFDPSMGAASRWWLHRSLKAFELPLTILKGNSDKILREVIQKTKATHLFSNSPLDFKCDVEIETFNGTLLWDPASICTRQMKPYQVFTPFYNCCLSSEEPRKPLPKPSFPKIETLKSDALDLLPRIAWDKEFDWEPGEEGARKQLARFLKVEKGYSENRDRPDLEGVSKLSPHLHFGEISPNTIWYKSEAESFKRQLVWREFAHHLLIHFPHTVEHPLRKEFESFPWRKSQKDLEAWQKGMTGYPLVDAGMRQLWRTGWMHNRVRMVVGSFLVKDLLISWREGAKWFWDTLVDADLANNTLGWQWVGGCGADAAPYFRVFNPVTQSEKFDPDGSYIRKWVPELADVPVKWIHAPWEAPFEIPNYPKPIVDHKRARERALEAFSKCRSS